MSYILDALRKADSDRERDPARGIHAQPRSPVSAGVASQLPGWVWPVTAAGVVVVAAVFWWPRSAPVALPDPPTMAAPLPVPAPATAPAAATPSPSPTVADSVSPPPPRPLPAAPVQRAPAEGPPNVPRYSGRMAPPAASAGVPGGPGVPAAAGVPGGASAKAAAPAPQAVVPTSEHVLAINELPPEVQRELPKLAISGGVHSENPAQRMLIVGGQVVNEGAELASGVVLEQIRPRSAVLRFRGYRYSVAY